MFLGRGNMRTINLLLVALVMTSVACTQAEFKEAQKSMPEPNQITDEMKETDEGNEPLDIVSFFEEVQPVLEARCTTCHNAQSRLDNFEDPEVVALKIDQIYETVVVTQTMPPRNRTAMTSEERDLFALWIEQGAPIE
jgi:uncharacterized membrane protein